MNITSISYKTASWFLIILGIGHTITDLTIPKTTQTNEFIFKMNQFTVQLLGNEVSLFSFHQGFSLMMGLLLVGYGTLNIFILKNNKQTSVPSNILLLNCIICLISLLLSIKYFFVVPITLTSISLFGFLISFISKTNKK